MRASEVEERIECLISLFEELYDFDYTEPKPPELGRLCRELTAQAAREVGMLDVVLNRFAKREMPWGQDARSTYMFRESLTIDSN